MAGDASRGAARLPTEVVDAFALDASTVVPVDAGKVNQVFQASQHGVPIAVRQSPWFRTLEEVAFEHDVLHGLWESGAPVARPTGAPVVVDNQVWLAFEWVKGTHPDRPVADPAWYGRLLATMHNAALRARLPEGQRPRWCPVDSFLEHSRAGGEVSLADVLPDFEAATGPLGRWLRRVAEDVHERLDRADLDSLPSGVVQGDFGPHQILLDAATESETVIDWDFCHRDLLLADLGIATSLARPTVDRAAAMLAGYLEVADDDPGDPALLGHLRSAFHLNNLANQVCALWVHGFDISPQLAVIRERLEREQWWGPVLASAMTQARPPSQPVGGPDASDLRVAVELADRASVVALHYFAQGVEAEHKADGSPVSVADRAVEAMLRESLAELRPDDAVLGEESGRTGAGSRTWIIDPIDGTSSFVAGRPGWFVQIALQERDRITVAVVDSPPSRTRWLASSGGGAWEEVTSSGGRTERRPLSVSANAITEEVTCAVHPPTLGQSLPADLDVVAWTPESLPALVRGEIDAFWVDCCEIWDHAPWVLLVEEAGGRFTDHDGGRRPDRRGGLYSNAAVHGALLRRLPPRHRAE